MQHRIFIAILTGLILFSSCSGTRYGYMPKVKATQKKETQSTTRKTKKTVVAIVANPIKCPMVVLAADSAMKPSKAFNSPAHNTSPKKHLVKVAPTAMQKKVDNVTRINRQQETINTAMPASSNDDFFGDLLEDLIGLGLTLGLILIVMLLIAGLGWLVANGFTWLAVLIVIAILVLLLMAISSFLTGVVDFFAGLFKRSY